MSYFIGIDLGGTVIKAGIYDECGNEVSVCEHNATLIAQHEGFSERNMDELWQSVCTVIQGALKSGSVNNADVKGVSFSSHGKGLYAVDKAGRPVRNGIISSDTRALSIVKKWLEDGRADKAYPYGMQQIWTGHPVAILRWLYENERENYDKIDSIFMVHDYVRFCMTGNKGAEITNISGSNLYNVKTGTYDKILASNFGIDECYDRLPPIVQSAQNCGGVTKEAAEATGLKEGTPVFGGFFDVVAASIASGVTDDTVLSATSGTWSIATTVHKSIKDDPHHYIWGNYCIPDLYFVHEGSPTSASNLAWWRNLLLKNVSLDECNAYVDKAQKERKDSSLFYFPYLFGSNFKLGQHASLYGLQAHHDMQDIVNALYEGIVFSHLINQDKVVKISPNLKTIRMAGGPTNSKPWMQMFASASNLPIEISSIKQVGCMAAALCAAVGSGHFKDFSEAVKATHKASVAIEPCASQHDYLRERYARFLEINKSL